MKYCKYITLLLLVITISNTVSSQYEYPGDENIDDNSRRKLKLNNKVFFGGNLGLAFGSQSAYIELCPIAGYRVTPRFWAGGGPQYLYQKAYYLKTHIYGFKGFTSFSILDNINETTNLAIKSVFIYAEDAVLSIEPLYYNVLYGPYYDKRNWYNLFLLGGGIRFPLGDRMGLSIMALWGLTPSTELLYSNPEVRLSIDF